MKRIKNKLSKVLFYFFILTTLSLLFIPYIENSNAQSDINYTFQNDELFDIDDINYNLSFNLRNQTTFTGVYNATYSFTNDTIGSTPNGWTDNSVGNTFATIITFLDGHSNVLQLNDMDNSNRASITTSVIQGLDNTIEWWSTKNSISANTNLLFHLYESSSVRLSFRLDNNDLDYHGGAGFVSLKDNFLIADTFFHFKLILDDSTNTFDMYINNVLEGNDLSYRTNSTFGIDRFDIDTDNPDIGYKGYFDAIGFTFDSNFDFENDTIGSVPGGWIPFPNPPLTSTTIENAFGSQVLQLNDSDITDLFDIEAFFPQEINQTIAFDVAVNTTTQNSTLNIAFLEGGTMLFRFRIDNDDLSYNIIGGIWIPLKEDFIIANTVFRIKIVLNDDDDTFNVYIDNILEVSDLSFRFAPTISANYMFLISDISTLCITYVDNFTFSSIPTYTIGTNLFPFIEINSEIQEVDRYEFNMKGINIPVIFTDTNVQGFTDVEINGGNVAVAIIGLPQDIDPSDKAIGLIVENTFDSAGIYKNFSITSKFVNVSFEFVFDTMTGNNGLNIFELYDSSDDLIASLLIINDGRLFYRHGSDWLNDWTVILPAGSFGVGIMYTFNLFLNYELNTTYLDYYFSGIYNSTFSFPLLENNHNGLTIVNMTVISIANDDIILAIDSIGVYDNGVSIVNDFSYGYTIIDLNISDWSIIEHNLFTIQAIGNFSIGFVDFTNNYVIGETYQDIEGFSLYTNTSTLINSFANYIGSRIFNSFIIITTNQTIGIISNIQSEGVFLTEGIGVYWLEYSFGNILPSESFFRVDILNRLIFSLTTDDTNLEFIQATFNTGNISTDDSAIFFRSNKNNLAFGELRLNYGVVSDIIEIPNGISNTRIIITQNQFLTEFIFLFSDNDIDGILGITTGFISNLQIIVISGLTTSIISLNLLAMIIPLIIIITPTLAFSSRLGKESIVPIFLIFSLIFTAVNTIPIWLFFIIAYSSLVFIFTNKNKIKI